MRWRKVSEGNQSNYYGLFKVMVIGIRITNVLECLIEPDSKTVFLKNDEETFYWCWVGNLDYKYYDIRDVVDVVRYMNADSALTFNINEFPDDDSAKLWFMLEYGR